MYRGFGSEVINGTFFAVGFIAVKLITIQLLSAKIILVHSKCKIIIFGMLSKC